MGCMGTVDEAPGVSASWAPRAVVVVTRAGWRSGSLIVGVFVSTEPSSDFVRRPFVRGEIAVSGLFSSSRDTFAPGLFDGVTVAITGGGSGIGRATALRFATLGAKVSLCGRRLGALEESRALVDAAAVGAGFSPSCFVRVADVKKPDELRAWAQATLDTLGPVDALVCNAGANFLAPAASISPNGFATVVGTIVLGTWNTVHAWYPHLSERGQASIVFMAATNGETASPLMAHSGAGKAGLLNLVQTLAVEWAAQGIRVNAVAPGPVDTEGANIRLWADDDARARVLKTVPLGRMGTPRDCADAVLFLCSPAGSFITGTALTIDGGNRLKPLPDLW
jgi:NAD(P)-dependent dehydrogenase (short-subunit alcohol dehydrogenase family)